MPVMHIESFKVRHYECDAYGHMNNAVYLRYMQEAGIEAAAVVGFDPQWHESEGRTWLPRRTEIEYLRPLQVGDQVEVRTWVRGFRRVFCRREYEFRKIGEEDIIAQAQTDWVFLERSRLMPATIPGEIKSAFVPEISRETLVPRIKFPEPPPPPEGIFKIQRPVEWQDIDSMQHLNNAAYLDYAMNTGVRLTSAFGWPMSKWMEEGIAFVARKNSIEYLIPAQMEDELEISTWLFKVRPATVTRHFDLRRAATLELLAQIQTVWVMMNLQTGRPMRIPASMLEILAPNIVSTIE
jgi:acyl-CoA thioester hydrolase